MSKFPFPRAAVPAELPRQVRPQIVSPGAEPPQGEGWLHEIKHDGHRLLAIAASDSLRLLSRNGRDRTALFREPFRPLAEAGLPAMVLDGEIAVPDERGVTHIDWLNDAISERRPERFAYFAFDLLHLDGHDLKRCPLEDRKALLRDLVGAARCERIVYVDHVHGVGPQLFEAVRQIGAEGIVSKRLGSVYCGGESRDWVKVKVFDTGQFVITGFSELGEGRLEAVYVAELRDGRLVPAGTVQFGLAGKGLWHRLDRLRDGSPFRKGFIPVRPELVAEVKFFGRIGRGFIRDGVLLGQPGDEQHR
jgi:bifunctional non-homologous end joining protein LigD